MKNRIENAMTLSGRLRVRVFDEDGGLVKESTSRNLVTLVGRNLARDLLRGQTTERITHFAVGSGATAAAEGDTALEAEVHRAAVSGFSEADGALVVSFYVGTTQANGNTLQEAGLFTAAEGGSLYARTTHTPVEKGAGVAVSYEWTINIGAA